MRPNRKNCSEPNVPCFCVEMAAMTVIGGGGWGTALSVLLSEKGHTVTLWVRHPEKADVLRREGMNARHLPGVTLPPVLRITASFRELGEPNYILWATPSTALAEIANSLSKSGLVAGAPVMVSCIKGLDHRQDRRMTQVLAEIFPHSPAAALSGPNHAEEVARFIPTATVVASQESVIAERLQEALSTRALRVYTSTDVVGVEVGGALKNVFALAAGICDGLGLGDNSKAALVTRSLAELSRIGTALGGRRETFQGLSGVGDLVGTCFSRHSRNRRVGERLARGESLAHIIESMGMVAEGIPTVSRAVELGERLGLQTPIVREVHAILHKATPPAEAMQRLLSRDLRPEED
jgi:glycerol-3-phosphate dehydrogenase (NAD(P)+)